MHPVPPEPFSQAGVAEAGHRIDPPVNDDAQLHVVIPRWQRPRVEGVPGWLVGSRKDGQRERKERQEEYHRGHLAVCKTSAHAL